MAVTRARRVAIAAGIAGLLALLPDVSNQPDGWSRAIAQTCVLTKGYWRLHTNAWPVTSLPLGAVTYSKSEAIAILDLNTKKDASLTLADQLIAAKLNIAHGSNPTPIASTLRQADQLLAAFPGRLPYNVPPNSSAGNAMTSAATTLEDYNAGRLPHSCGTGNTPPVATAGLDQTVSLGSVVTLNGSASSDADGDPLTFTWSFVSKPGSSIATLSDTHAVMPTFRADVAGTYDVQLVVNDGIVDSAPDTVRISTQNSRPVANAGPDQSLAVGGSAQLDGSASSDPDGDSLTFAWSLVSIPSGSAATLSSASAVKPTFTIDRPGNYTAQLIVSDGQLSSAPDTITISTTNSPPTANAGPDQTAPVNATVTLNGSGSSDVDGDPLVYAWSFVSKPASSQAALANPASVAPSFVIDASGTYVVQLIVNDGHVNSAADTVAVTTTNSRPVANAGPDQTVFAGASVPLDGSGSTDIDGNPLTFTWALTTRPAGSVAALSNTAAVKPTFVADLPGDYIAQLIVNDGTLDSTPDTVAITTVVQNRPPAADAGPDQTVALGATAQLDGSGSSDPDGDTLIFKWSLLSVPTGSTATLSDPAVFNPTFMADKAGSYVGQLIVNDGAVDSSPRTVTISTQNSAPTANAGPNQTVGPNATVQLDGSGSFDPDGTALTYAWSLLSAPSGSGATLSNPTNVNPAFVADLEGVYVAQLIVSDGVLFSAPVTVTVTAQNPADLSVRFDFISSANPPVGSTIFVRLIARNAGPGGVHNAGAQYKLPAGYTLLSFGGSGGTYDPASGVWTIGEMPVDQFYVDLNLTVNATGPYDLTASISDSIAPDPDPSNNTATAQVSPNSNADLQMSYFNAPIHPAVGSRVDFFVTIANHGPSPASDVTAQFTLPAGYTLISSRSGIGTYDPATGVWTIGSLPCCPSFDIAVSAIVNASGPYDLTATVTHSSAPDPDLSNNSVTAHVSPDSNADLSISFFNPPAGFHMPGTDVDFFLIVQNLGPSSATGVSAHFQIPAGYSLFRGGVPSQGSYDPATGDWTIGVVAGAQQASIGFSATINASGPAALVATITGSSQPDPNVANNIAAPPPINRPPIPQVGPDQTLATNTPVSLDGTQSFDPDGDAFTYQWTFALHPLNSLATIANANTATPSFVPDRGGRYIPQLTLIDSHGVASLTPARVTIIANELNHAPVIRSTPITTAAVGQPYNCQVIAVDPDAGDVLTFSLTAPPAGMTIDPASGQIAWTPSAAQGGSQAVSIRVQDSGGLFATQTFAVQVSSDTEHAPIANGDSYQVHVNESLGVNAPGVLANDADLDGHPLSVRLLKPPANGSVSLGGDGSFTYTPNTLQPNEFVLAENVNLATAVPGVTAVASSSGFGGGPAAAIDDNLATSWIPTFDATPFLEIVFPQDVTVAQVQLFGHRSLNLPGGTSKATAGILQLQAADGQDLYTSGNVELPAPARDGAFVVPGVPGVRRVRFTITDGDPQIFGSGFGELRVIGSVLLRRERKLEPNLMQLLPVAVQASSVNLSNIPEAVADDALNTNWYAASLSPGEFIEATFPVDVTVTQLETLNAGGRPDGFGTSQQFNCSGVFALFDAAGTELFNSGVLPVLRGGPFQQPFSVPVPNLAGVRRARITIADCTGTQLPPGFSEFHVFGQAPLDTPAFSLAKKFQVLTGREAHSTPIVANLTDDNGDGRIDANDIPDILQPVESIASGQLKGEIKVVSGDDGRLLFTAGGPDLVSPWSEVAVGDLDGDGIPEIVAVHSDGNHLVAFEHTGAIRWISDANPMPRFFIGSSALIGGAVSIANLDGAGRPEIIVGASVFDADGHLLGDGRSLGGTTAGTGLRSAISAIADIDLDGTPEIVAGPTAYRLANGQLTKVWQRSDRSDGYVAIANFDDDPQAEIVSVASGFVYMLNHDGSDADVWNAPSHAPVPIPGGGDGGSPLVVDVDGDGIPEIGVAAQTRYTVFNRDGSVRWTSAIMDRSSHSTGSVAFDLDGDGAIEIIYRDQNFLRVFRGNDGVLLAKTPVGSGTWSEEPVVADVDNDGHADIVVSSDFQNQTAGDTGVIVLQDIANKWTRTRRIWNQHGYHVTNVNEDGTIPLHETPHWLTSGLNAFRINLFVPGETPDGGDSFTYVATDGTLESNVATVHIAVRTPNGPPQFASAPIGDAAANVPYVYAARASDPDPGDILTFSLATAPNGMTIDSSTGLIRWTPTGSELGDHDVVVKVRDVRGLFALQSYSAHVSNAVVVPDVVGQDQAAAQSAITSAALSVGAISSQNSPTAPTGSVMSQTPAGGTLAAPSAPVNLVVSSGPAPAGTVPDVVGQPQSHAQVDISAAGFTVGPIGGQNHATIPSGIVLSQSPAGGTQAASGSPISVVVSLGPFPGDFDQDGDGFTPNGGDCNDGSAAIHPGASDTPGDGIDQDCNGRDAVSGDTTAPTTSLDAPADGATLMMPVDIVGTATDANFLRYSLYVGPAGDPNPQLLASGTSPVLNSVLTRLDPTRLENGVYVARLIAEDSNGQMSIAERAYHVDGQAKPGLMSLSFIDLQVPLSGIPITVTRTYDNRVKSPRDFGVGWSLGVSFGKYQNNRPPGQGWIVNDRPVPGGSLPCIGGISETRPHFTDVRLSDREVYTFGLVLTGGTLGITGGCEATASFRFITGTTLGATLEILDPAQVLYLRGGDDTVVDLDAFLNGTERAFNPRHVRLTTVDGRKIDLDAAFGITRLEDANGNTLSITPSGIVHSSGRSIAIARDPAGRITSITDPQGGVLTYQYDGRGDLVTFVDREDNSTTFSYDAAHNLIELHDPLGNRALRSEYDADGRLIATIDAQGNRIDLTHDLAAMREVVRDRRGNVTIVEYDVAGNVTARVDQLGKRREYTFDARNNQLTEKDPLGRVATKVYDGFDNAITSTDFDGNRSTFTYDGRRNVTTAVDPEGLTTRYGYDSRGNLLNVTAPEGGVTRYQRNPAGDIVSITDALGNTTRSTYDAAGNLVSGTDAMGQGTNASYDASGNVLSDQRTRTVGSQAEIVTRRSLYDAANRRTAWIDALGNTLTFAYSPLGQLDNSTDASGNTTQLVYDESGNLTKTIFADGSVSSATYDPEGRVLRRTDRDGNVTRYEYDAVGRQIAVTHPDGAAVSRTYDAVARVSTIRDENGNDTLYSYGPNTQSVTDALGGTTTHTFDSKRNRTGIVDALGHSTAIEYDSGRRVTRMTYADGSAWNATYDQAGRRTAVTDQAGRQMQFGYDLLGRIVSITDPAGGATAFAYDSLGNLISHTDANGRATAVAYDAAGRVTERTRPMGQQESFVYDATGQVAAHTDFNGRTTQFEYDTNNRLVLKQLPGGASIAYEYTPAGHRTRAGGESYAYDARGRIANVTNVNGDVVSYTYDAAGNRTSITTASRVTQFGYDVLNRLSTIIDANGTTQLAYDAVGNLARKTYPNGVTSNYTYDALNRLMLIQNVGPAGLISSYAYTLAPDGKRTRVVESGSATTGRTVDYVYDALGRLTREQIDEPNDALDQVITYEYDAVGNRLRKVVAEPTRTVETTYAHDENDRLLTETTTSTAISTAADHTLRYLLMAVAAAPVVAPVLSFGWWWARRRTIGRRRAWRLILQTAVTLLLIVAQLCLPTIANAATAGITSSSQAGPVAIGALQYTYDANGNMLSRSDGVRADTYIYDGENRLISATILTGANPGISSYTYDADGIRTSSTHNGATTRYVVDKTLAVPQVVAEISGAEVVSYTYGADLISQTRPGTGARFYLFDGQGSTRQLTSDIGATTDTYTFDAFGNLLASTGTTANLYLYNGQQLDPNLGFYYLRARYYAQALGRFVTTDPFEGTPYDPVSLHRYLYANADPVNNSDPLGLTSLAEITFTMAVNSVLISLVVGAVGAIIGGVVGGGKGCAIGFLIGFFVAFAFTPAGRVLLTIAGERLGILTVVTRAGPTVGRKVGEGVAKIVANNIKGTNPGRWAMLPFLPEPEQQPRTDAEVGGVLGADPDDGLLSMKLFMGFFEDALSPSSLLTIGPGPASVRPYLERLKNLLIAATPSGIIDVIPEEE